MSELGELKNEVLKFRDDRNWSQFHTPKDLAAAIAIEASELQELFLWKKSSDAVSTERVSEELADVVIYALYLAEHYGLNISDIVRDKIRLNQIKYPINKSKGKSNKYDSLD